MESSVPATMAKQRFGELFGRVAFGKDHVSIEKKGKALAVLIPMEAYQEYLDLKKREGRKAGSDLLREVDRWRNRQPKNPARCDAVLMIRELRHGR